MRDFFKKCRRLAEYAVFRLIAALFQALPLETASAASGWCWRHLAPISSRHARALENLALAYPDMGVAEREKIARDMWENLGRNLAEAFHLRQIAGGDRITIENPDFVEALARNSAGKLFCSGHIANWELIVAGMVRHGLKPMSIYQRLSNPMVDGFVYDLRRFLYTGGLFPKGSGTARELIRSARGGADIAFLVDLRDFSGVSVDFFGHPAPSTPFPALLVQKLDLPAYLCVLVREPNVRFRFRMEPIALRRDEDRQADIVAITGSIHAALERVIREHPAQWMWAHRRWG